MRISNTDKSDEANETPHNWYDDSLSLITPVEKNSTGQIATTCASVAHAELSLPGLLLKSNDNSTLREIGNCNPCHAYLAGSKSPETTSGLDVVRADEGIIIASRSETTQRVIYLHHQALKQVLRTVVPGAEFPKSEINLLMQILCGLSLKQAGDADQVSYETKRSQFKSLAARTGFNTQNEVIRNILLALVMQVLDVLRFDTEQSDNAKHETDRFLNTYYPGLFRFHQITLANGRILRVAETGPLDGETVIWLHSQTLPSPEQFASDWRSKNGIRLVIPLRPGFLEHANTRYSIATHIKQSTDELLAAINHFGNGRARLVANSTGAPYAINLATNFPQHVKHITFCASSYVGRYANQPVRRLVSGVKNLVTKNELLIASMFERYLSKMSSLPGIKSVLESSYKNSGWDMAVFNQLLSNPVNHSWMYESYRFSRHSVILDVAMGGYDVWKNAGDISCGTLFIHGAHDPINSADDAKLAARLIPNSQFKLLENEGQSLFLTRLGEIAGMGQ